LPPCPFAFDIDFSSLFLFVFVIRAASLFVQGDENRNLIVFQDNRASALIFACFSSENLIVSGDFKPSKLDISAFFKRRISVLKPKPPKKDRFQHKTGVFSLIFRRPIPRLDRYGDFLNISR
jgi:hypothetical protein